LTGGEAYPGVGFGSGDAASILEAVCVWFTSVRDICQGILELACWHCQIDVFSPGNVSSVFYCLEHMEHRNLRRIISSFVTQVSRMCPEHRVVDVFIPFLEPFLRTIVQRQNKAWAQGASSCTPAAPLIPIFGIEAPTSEAGVKELCEIVAEASLRHVSRSFADYLNTLFGVTDAQLPPGHVSSRNQSKYKPLCPPERLRKVLFFHPSCAQAIIEALTHCLECPDAATCAKAAEIVAFLIDEIFSVQQLRSFAAASILRSCLTALFTPSTQLDQGTQHALASLVNVIFCSEVLLLGKIGGGKGHSPALTCNEDAKAIMMAIPGSSPNKLRALSERIASAACDKDRRNAMKDYLQAFLLSAQPGSELSKRIFSFSGETKMKRYVAAKPPDSSWHDAINAADLGVGRLFAE